MICFEFFVRFLEVADEVQINSIRVDVEGVNHQGMYEDLHSHTQREELLLSGDSTMVKEET